MKVAAGVALALPLAGSCGGSDPATDRGELSEAAQAPDEPSTGELAYFAPDPMPTDARVVTASIGTGADTDVDGSIVVLGRPDGDAFTGVLRVLVATAGEGEDPRRYSEVSKVDLGDRDGYALDDPVVGSYVSWIDGPWHVTVTGPAGAADVVLDVARSVDVDDEGAARVRTRPGDYVEVGRIAWSGGGARPTWSLALETEEPHRGMRSIDGSIVPAGPSAWPYAVGDRLVPVIVRGREGVVAERSIRYPGREVDTVFRTLTWLERPDLAITVREAEAGTDRLLEVATSLREVDQAAFEALRPG